MKNFKKNIDGITLIALVISIIVLLILAGVSIAMLTGENGILAQAQKAKEQTEKASEEEQRTLSKYEYEFAKSQGEINETETFGEYSMEKEIKEKYGQDIKIGDTVNYQDNVDEYNGTWKVLGIENGQILLMSSKPVSKDFAIKGREGFLNFENKLNEACKQYGTGIGAESARSLKVEDINKITDYNPENPEKAEKFRKGTVTEYGTKVTFTLDDDGNVKYQCSNGQSLNTNLTSLEHVDGRKLDNNNLEISIVNGVYWYHYELKEWYDEYGKQQLSTCAELSEGLKNLFISDEFSNRYRWLANKGINAIDVSITPTENCAIIFSGYRLGIGSPRTQNFEVATWGLFRSDKSETEKKADITAVVLLKPNVTFTKGENDTWNLNT